MSGPVVVSKRRLFVVVFVVNYSLPRSGPLSEHNLTITTLIQMKLGKHRLPFAGLVVGIVINAYVYVIIRK